MSLLLEFLASLQWGDMNEDAQRLPSAFRFTEPRQRRIHRLLSLIGPGPAHFYRDVCRLLGEGPMLDSTTHLVAHLLRDIESAIRDVLIPHDYKPPAEKHGRFKAEIDAILKTYGIADDDPVAIAWRGLPDRSDERWLGRLAHRSALAAPRRLDAEFRKFHGEVERILEVVLGRFEGRFTTSFKLLDVLIAKTVPTRDDAKIVRGKIPNNLVSLNYFFGKIESAGWLDLLAREGFFQRPPEPIRDDAKSETSFPPWPESRYLARMASKPELQVRVVDIALTIPETPNVNVHNDIMTIALTVPAPLSARLAPGLSQALKQPSQLGLAHRVGEFVSHLARGGEGAAALQPTEIFLTILPDPDVQEITVEGKPRRLLPHPRTPFDKWVLEQFLTKNLDDVVDANGIATVALVCKALDDAVRLSRSRLDEEGPDDYSRIWRPAIDQQQEDRGHDLKSTLVIAVRQATERLIQREPSLLSDVIEELEAHRWAVFRRISLHILRQAPASALSLVEARLGRWESFSDRDQKREFMLLAQAWFPRLGPEIQSTIMRWIDEGPELDDYQRMQTEMGGTPPTEAELAEYADRRRLEDLRALREVLPVGWRTRYQALIEKYGEPEMPDFLAIRMGSVTRGPGSPIAGTEIRQMRIPDLVDWLKSWEPAREFLGPSPESLGRELSGAVTDEPARFAEEAERFREVDPTYVRGLITGLRDAVNKDRPFDWGPVLRLCKWVLEQPVERADGDTWERDRGFRSTRKAIADLLEDGFRLTPARVPFDLRQEAWHVLLPLTSDPNPEAENEVEGAESEPATTSINTTRGEAMHALMRYAIWVKEHVKQTGGRARKKVGMREMPEARLVLEAHLDPALDSSLAIRSVYGQWLPSLVYVDPVWVKANLRRIFPTNEELARFRDAAWETYVVFCPMYDKVGDLLKDEYRRAAERIGQTKRSGRSPADPADHLAEHLMALYWRGKIDLNGPELTEFYANAPDDVRGHGMWFVGRVFAKDARVPAKITERMKKLFESRLAALSSEPQQHRGEIEQYGSWFASERFDDEWSISKLQESLKLVGSAEPDSLVLDQLVKLAAARPMEVLECVRLMVEGAKERWSITAWQDEIRQIVKIALQRDKRARDAATTLVNILVARGHLDEFHDLLEGA